MITFLNMCYQEHNINELLNIYIQVQDGVVYNSFSI